MYIVGFISIAHDCAVVNFELWNWKNEELEVDFVSYEEDKPDCCLFSTFYVGLAT